MNYKVKDNKINTMSHMPLTDPNIMHWRNWHFGKVKNVSDQDVADFVSLEHELRHAIPSSSLNYVIVAHELSSTLATSANLPHGLAIKSETIQALACQYDVHPDIILIRIREVYKKNKNIPRYNEVMHIYLQQKRDKGRGKM